MDRMSPARFAVLLALTACNNSPGMDVQDGLPCRLAIDASGGQFSPDTCEFQSVIPGVPCGDDQACPPDYVVAMRDTAPGLAKGINGGIRH
jgi:hypothetical protein